MPESTRTLDDVQAEVLTLALVKYIEHLDIKQRSFDEMLNVFDDSPVKVPPELVQAKKQGYQLLIEAARDLLRWIQQQDPYTPDAYFRLVFHNPAPEWLADAAEEQRADELDRLNSK